jgi:MerR family regulatory protein
VDMAGLTIGKFAAAEGVGVETVRFYQRRGLLAQPERRGGGFREYSEIVRAAGAKLAAVDEQLRELALLQCRLRRLVRVCEHGDGDDCVALHLRGDDVSGGGAARAGVR